MGLHFFITITVVLVVVMQQTTVAFQLQVQPQFQFQFHSQSQSRSNVYGHGMQLNLNKNSFNEMEEGQQEQQPQPQPQQETTQRRHFLRSSMSLLFTTATATTATSTMLSFPNAAEASTDTSGYIPDMIGGLKKPPKAVGGLTKKIRKVGDIMDELQRDLMQERWDLVEKYPDQLRSFVPVFTTYTDSAFPSDAPTDGGLRVALRYEVGRFFASVERLKQATSRRALEEAYLAYSDMALHFDRYLHVGGLYTYYDATITNEEFFKNVSRDSLIYSNPKSDPALVRDLIVLTDGPDMGKTGIVLGLYKDGSNNCVVKLDRYMGLREIRVVPKIWAAKRLGEQNPDDVFLIARKE